MSSTHTAAFCAALTLAFSGEALAHHPSGPGNTNASGPINTISADTLEQGDAVAGLSLEQTSIDTLGDDVLAETAEAAAASGQAHAHFHSLESIRGVALGYAYGLDDDLSLSVRLPLIAREGVREGHAHEESPGVIHGEAHALGDVSGVGDISVLAQWRFHQDEDSGLQVAALFGFEAPTGSANERNDEGEVFDSEFQPGSDSWDFIGGLALTQRLDHWSFDASGLYTFAGDGAHDSNLGDRFNYGVALSRRVFGAAPHHHDGDAPAHSDGLGIDLVFELNGEWRGEATGAGETDPNSGGHALYFAPGVRASRDKLSGFVSLGAPIMRDLNGLQAEPDLRASAGMAVRF